MHPDDPRRRTLSRWSRVEPCWICRVTRPFCCAPAARRARRSKPRSPRLALSDAIPTGERCAQVTCQLHSHYAPSRPVRLEATSVSPDEGPAGLRSTVPAGAMLTNESQPERQSRRGRRKSVRHDALPRPSGHRRIAVMPIPHIGLGLAPSTTASAVPPRMTAPTGSASLPSKRETMPDTCDHSDNPDGPVTPAILEALRAIVGDKGLIADDQGKQPFVTDWRGSIVGNAGGRGAAGQRRGSLEGREALLRQRHRHRAQAGNTGLMGGATPWPSHTGIVLSVGRMNKVLNVDPVGYSMTVEAGCVLQTLQETAASHDRFFPLFLGAQGSCMIGGNLSTNAGGVQVLRYGTRATSSWASKWCCPTATSGTDCGRSEGQYRYDLKHLFMGAEGTLGHHHQGGAETVAGGQGRGHRVARHPRSAGRHRDPVRGAWRLRGQCRLVRADEPDLHRHGSAQHSGHAGSAEGRHAVVPAARMDLGSPQGRGCRGHVGEDEQFLATRWRRAGCSTPSSPERGAGAQYVGDP